MISKIYNRYTFIRMSNIDKYNNLIIDKYINIVMRDNPAHEFKSYKIICNGPLASSENVFDTRRVVVNG